MLRQRIENLEEIKTRLERKLNEMKAELVFCHILGHAYAIYLYITGTLYTATDTIFF